MTGKQRDRIYMSSCCHHVTLKPYRSVHTHTARGDVILELVFVETQRGDGRHAAHEPQRGGTETGYIEKSEIM